MYIYIGMCIYVYMYAYVYEYGYIYLPKIYMGIGNDADNYNDGSNNLSAIVKLIRHLIKIIIIIQF